MKYRAYLLITSLLATEIYIRWVHQHLPTLPMRVYVFFVCLPFSWLFMHIIGIDTGKSKKTILFINTEKEELCFKDKDNDVKRELKFQERKNKLLERYWGRECKSHSETAELLDKYIEKNEKLNFFINMKKYRDTTCDVPTLMEKKKRIILRSIYWQMMVHKAVTLYYIKKVNFFAECTKVYKEHYLKSSNSQSASSTQTTEVFVMRMTKTRGASPLP